MYINEVCKLIGLTKKAVEYYEQQGLLQPEILENGYRKYGNAEVSVLKEISLLRKLGISIADIKTIFASDDKPTSLAECRRKMMRQIDTMSVQRDCMKYLIDNGYDIDNSFQYVTQQLDENRAIGERLAEAFPGNYGLFLSHHFGQFLKRKIDGAEKQSAYGKILEFLDNIVDIPFPKELEDYLMEASALWDENAIQNIDSNSKAAAEDYNGFMEKNREAIEMYLDYCNSDEYKSSHAYKMKTLMLEFQQTNGYYDVFVANMKILSKEYSDYLEKLYDANDLFLREYPNVANINKR